MDWYEEEYNKGYEEAFGYSPSKSVLTEMRRTYERQMKLPKKYRLEFIVTEYEESLRKINETANSIT